MLRISLNHVLPIFFAFLNPLPRENLICMFLHRVIKYTYTPSFTRRKKKWESKSALTINFPSFRLPKKKQTLSQINEGLKTRKAKFNKQRRQNICYPLIFFSLYLSPHYKRRPKSFITKRKSVYTNPIITFFIYVTFLLSK